MSIHLALKSERGAAWHTESLLANSGSRGERWGKLPHRNCPWCWSGKRFSLLHTCVLPKKKKTLKSQGWHFNAFYCISILFSDGSLSQKIHIRNWDNSRGLQLSWLYLFIYLFFFSQQNVCKPVKCSWITFWTKLLHFFFLTCQLLLHEHHCNNRHHVSSGWRTVQQAALFQQLASALFFFFFFVHWCFSGSTDWTLQSKQLILQKWLCDTFTLTGGGKRKICAQSQTDTVFTCCHHHRFVLLILTQTF